MKTKLPIMNRKMMKEIHKAKIKMPNWIDTTLKLHYKIWNVMTDCNNIIIYNLLIDDILTDDEINGVIDIFELNIINVLSLGYDLEIAVYYELFTKYLMVELVEFEQYEAAHNLKKMIDRYFTTKYEDFNND